MNRFIVDDEQLVEDFKDSNSRLLSLIKLLRKHKKSVDEDTGYQISQQLHQLMATSHQGLALLEEVKRVRISQKTSKVGGGRRKR